MIYKLNIRPEDVDKFLEPWASGAKTMKQPAWIHIHTASSRDFWYYQDVDPAEANIMAITQKPFHQSNFVAPSGPPAWKQLPT